MRDLGTAEFTAQSVLCVFFLAVKRINCRQERTLAADYGYIVINITYFPCCCFFYVFCNPGFEV